MKKKIDNSVQKAATGFTLLEVMVVLGIIGGIAAVIIPNIGLTSSSQMRISLSELTTTIKSTYDAAVLGNRVHRLVIQLKTGEYWTEQSPLGFRGRPPLIQNDDFKKKDDNARKFMMEDLDKIASEQRASDKNNKDNEETRYYSIRSILVVQRKNLKPIFWSQVDDPVLFKQSLGGNIAFSSIFTASMRDKMDFNTADKNATAYIYFYPSGEAEQASIQLGTLLNEKEFKQDGPKFTLVVDSLTGHSEILEGFQDVEFVKLEK